MSKTGNEGHDLSLQKLSDSELYSENLGIDLKEGSDREIFKWWLAAILMGNRIQEHIALDTFRAFDKHHLTTPESILKAGWEYLVNPIMQEGGYARMDERMSTQIMDMCQELVDDWDGSLTAIHQAATSNTDLERKLGELTGAGPTTVNIFLREMRFVWEHAYPAPSRKEKQLAEAAHLNLKALNRNSEQMARVEAGLFWHRDKLES